VTFTPEIYEQIREGAQRSASIVVPFVQSFVDAKSVVDVGGGEGWWAEEFARDGARALVLDETGPVPPLPPTISERGVERAYFDAVRHAHWPLEEKFDLAVCLEVAEHVDAETGDYLVEFLTAAAPVILFSAAIPGQGGHGHVNEQWPQYWAERFYEDGLVCTEKFRDEFWDNEKVEPWYRQNLLLFARYEWFDEHRMSFTKYPRAMVHPVIWEHRRQR